MAFDILQQVRDAAAKRILLLPHALQQMVRPDRSISPEEIRSAVSAGDLIEDYPEDVRGHSCLLLGRSGGGRPVHVVCSPKAEYLAVITTYVPDPEQWSDDFLRRR